MQKITSGLTISLDGFGAGVNQSFENPFGDNFDADLLDNWMFAEPEKQKHQKEIDAILDAGAFIMGSNMFGPKDRRDTPEWKGWWGDNPPYNAPVFVLSHTQRDRDWRIRRARSIDRLRRLCRRIRILIRSILLGRLGSGQFRPLLLLIGRWASARILRESRCACSTGKSRGEQRCCQGAERLTRISGNHLRHRALARGRPLRRYTGGRRLCGQP